MKVIKQMEEQCQIVEHSVQGILENEEDFAAGPWEKRQEGSVVWFH